MKKSSIYLDPELDRALAQAAARQGISKAEYIRRTLTGAVGEELAVRPRAIGVFDGPGNLAATVDERLADGLGER